MNQRILIVDDDEEIRTQMKWALAKDYDIFVAEDRTSALEVFRAEGPDLTLLDLGLPPKPNDPTEGFATLTEILGTDPSAKVIVISGQGEKKCALQAIGSGASDFLCKPVEMEELRFLLKRHLYVAELEREYAKLQSSRRPQVFEGLFAASPQMRKVFGLVEKVAPSEAPVLILGESGTGKEMIATAIHRRSPRRDEPFVAINCSSIPENLIESELFGSEKGAFTGADKQRKGLIESAAGGTLFLDEIGDLPAAMQVKLLRFLQDKRVQRVGGREHMQIDTRVVAATNADLQAGILDGSFREDLYFRLAVVVISLPALREREDDAILLAEEFLQQYAKENGKTNVRFASDTLRAIAHYRWPGNVRELQNRVQGAVVLADGPIISVKDMELGEVVLSLPPQTLKDAKDRLEKELIERSLLRHGGQITAVAKELDVSRPTLYTLMGKLGIHRETEEAKAKK